MVIRYTLACDRCGHELTSEDTARDAASDIRRSQLTEIGVIRNGKQVVAARGDMCDACSDLLIAINQSFGRGCAIDEIVSSFGTREVKGRNTPWKPERKPNEQRSLGTSRVSSRNPGPDTPAGDPEVSPG